MSSRLTTPVSKLTRSISTTASIARPSHLLNNVSKSATAKTGRKRQTKVTSAAEDQSAEVAADVSHFNSDTNLPPLHHPHPSLYQPMY